MSEQPMPQSAFVLAAGLGTRMRPLTETMPKAMVPVAGRPLIDHALDRVAASGIARAVVNLHHFADLLEHHLAARPAAPATQVSDERQALLDTGGGLAGAHALLGVGPVLALNSDAIFAGPEPMPPLIQAWSATTGIDALLLLAPRAATVGYTRPGDFFLEAEPHHCAVGRPRRRADAATAPYVYTGAQVLGSAARAMAAEIAAETPVFSLNAVWDRLLANGRLGAMVWPVGAGTAAPGGLWVDVGTPAGIGAAEAALAAAARA